ncbi:MAG: hypothetical protein IKR17_00605 [Bacteroidales bacterium]|nr:hypothetical protein [Bacteroidales bacterium]
MKYFVAFLLFFLPTSIARLMIWTSRYKIEKGCKIGFSLILVDKMLLENGARIGNLNIISCCSLSSTNGSISHLNIINGKFDFRIEDGATIHNQNKITSPKFNPNKSSLTLKECARIGVGHTFDLTSDVIIGKYACFAGLHTQVWTHSFYYSQTSSRRCRVDKPVIIGDYCNIGSRSIICPGVTLANGVCLGAGSTASKSLSIPGLYVQQSLRLIENFNPEKAIEESLSSEYTLDEYHIVHHSLSVDKE